MGMVTVMKTVMAVNAVVPVPMKMFALVKFPGNLSAMIMAVDTVIPVSMKLFATASFPKIFHQRLF